MKVDDLDHKELLELDPAGGLIRFAGQRALLLDAVAMGLHRKYLVENFGSTAARTVLTQFGFAHGWRMAEAMRSEFEWASEDDWRGAGIRLHALGGLFCIEPGAEGPRSKNGMMLLASYEAEQHLLHFGRADVPVCWTISGLISGYLSCSSGEEIYVLEDRCMGKGDAGCHLFARTRTEWGDGLANELRFFDPSQLKECLDVSLQRVMETLKVAERKLRGRQRTLVRVAHELDNPLGIIAKSPTMQQVVDLARRVAKVDSTVLITGESGSGKERIARLVHDESTRAAGPFIAVNCGAIAETLLESELFGHARGAFTGATHDRPGLFESANTGTLFLDEVGEVSPGMQVKLLRAVQEREIRRVGESKSRKIDVRIVAATHRDLVRGVAEGTFRQDLYYRLNVVALHVPALRERRDDILPLARVLLADVGLRLRRNVSGLSPNAADQLLRHDWPGNVRELENAMERAVALAQGSRVELVDLPEEIRQALPKPVATNGAVRPLDEIEREYILAALALNSGNQTHTAEQLRIGSATLYRKLKNYGVIGKKRAANTQTDAGEGG
ncbi:MAG: sigma-54-dependent Fis family transcriptional regulator [Deltaproteobacteria bacterium]|nr:sigma-54-dependent Fis family transcriptional regulator [Deltaproteobacteria bacterium]